ncbi:hypothetical protein Tco_1244710, partial [Tanacetum coccineum]
MSWVCTVNIHPSLLRLFCGATPVQRALQVQEGEVRDRIVIRPGAYLREIWSLQKTIDLLIQIVRNGEHKCSSISDIQDEKTIYEDESANTCHRDGAMCVTRTVLCVSCDGNFLLDYGSRKHEYVTNI